MFAMEYKRIGLISFIIGAVKGGHKKCWQINPACHVQEYLI